MDVGIQAFAPVATYKRSGEHEGCPMKILMVSFDIQEFGGLEEYAVSLAVALTRRGQEVAWFSAAWVDPENQYAQRLNQAGIKLIQPPKWISHLASNWVAKERFLRGAMWILSPVVLLLGLAVALLQKRSPIRSWLSAHNWVKGRLMDGVIGRDYRPQVGRVLLNWWNWRWGADLLHIQGYTTSLLFVIDWAHAKGVPVAYEEHQTPDPQFNWWKGFEASINKADRVIAVSEKSAQGLRSLCKVVRPIIVRNPLLSDPFVDGGQPRDRNQSHETVRITTVARLYVTKGLTYLLETAALVKATHPEVEFVVYGEGELRAELVAQAERLGLDGDKTFPGAFSSREELARILHRTDIFLLPSILEGQPLALVEAMAHGCPIVSTDVGGIPELITDAVNGLLCAPREPSCLAEKVLKLIDDPEFRGRLGRAARNSYKTSPFEAGAMAEFFTMVYRNVLEERHAHAA